MIGAFASHLPGIREQEVIGKVQPASGPITVGDTKYAISKAPKVKGIITGPTTLAHGLHISTPMYRNKEELVPDIAAALLAEARALEAAGITLLQIDEPIFSTGIADLAVGKQAIDMITSGLHTPVCMHVCGNLGNVIDELLKFNVNVLDFEFANNPAQPRPALPAGPGREDDRVRLCGLDNGPDREHGRDPQADREGRGDLRPEDHAHRPRLRDADADPRGCLREDEVHVRCGKGSPARAVEV